MLSYLAMGIGVVVGSAIWSAVQSWSTIRVNVVMSDDGKTGKVTIRHRGTKAVAEMGAGDIRDYVINETKRRVMA